MRSNGDCVVCNDLVHFFFNLKPRLMYVKNKFTFYEWVVTEKVIFRLESRFSNGYTSVYR